MEGTQARLSIGTKNVICSMYCISIKSRTAPGEECDFPRVKRQLSNQQHRSPGPLTEPGFCSIKVPSHSEEAFVCFSYFFKVHSEDSIIPLHD